MKGQEALTGLVSFDRSIVVLIRSVVFHKKELRSRTVLLQHGLVEFERTIVYGVFTCLFFTILIRRGRQYQSLCKFLYSYILHYAKMVLCCEDMKELQRHIFQISF